MQISRKRRSYGMTGWVIIGLILAVFAYASRHTLFNVAYGSSSKSDLGGEWVGLVDITGGYDEWLGPSPGKHGKAAIRFDLAMYDSIVNKYAGPGEMHIEGEAQPRAIKIVDVFLDMQNQPTVSGTMVGDWGPDDRGEKRHGHDFKAVLHGNDLELTQNNPLGLQFKGMLHRGTDADYERLYNSIR